MFGTVRVYPFRDGTYDLEWAVKGKDGKDKACFNLSPNGKLTKFNPAKWKHSPWIKIDSWDLPIGVALQIRFRMLPKSNLINY